MGKQIYNWESNIIDFVDVNENKFYFQLKGNKTIISGMSASGKTLLCTRIKQIIDDRNISMKPYNADNVFVVTQDNIEKIYKQQNKLIIMDRADLLITDRLVKHINSDFSNRYLLFLRKPVGIELSPNHFAELYKDDDNSLKLKYDFDDFMNAN
jgi:hypothetical protein